MEIAIFWILFGALIGGIAASSRGWSVAAGALGGALLGLLSPLLFFVDGVAPGDGSGGGHKTCPRCAERVKAAAQVCKHCGHEFNIIAEQDHQAESRARALGAAIREAAKPAEFSWSRLGMWIFLLVSPFIAIITLLVMKKTESVALPMSVLFGIFAIPTGIMGAIGSLAPLARKEASPPPPNASAVKSMSFPEPKKRPARVDEEIFS